MLNRLLVVALLVAGVSSEGSVHEVGNAIESSDEAAERIHKVFDKVRKLQTSVYSYDFDCVSSLSECITDSQCDDDEYCYFSTSRKKRALREASPQATEKGSRQLLFGTNTVGQCVCA